MVRPLQAPNTRTHPQNGTAALDLLPNELGIGARHIELGGIRELVVELARDQGDGGERRRQLVRGAGGQRGQRR